MKYINKDNVGVNIKKLKNDKLVALYKFMLTYCKVVNNGPNMKDDQQFIDYITNMVNLKDTLRDEIKTRKLKMSNFK